MRNYGNYSILLAANYKHELKKCFCTPMDVALYARVSTNEQQTLPMQLEQMREYAKKRGWTIKHEIEEIGSGAKTRPKKLFENS